MVSRSVALGRSSVGVHFALSTTAVPVLVHLGLVAAVAGYADIQRQREGEGARARLVRLKVGASGVVGGGPEESSLPSDHRRTA